MNFDACELGRNAGLFPDMVQVGNEITNGLLWPNGKKPDYDAIARLVNAGIRGARAVDADYSDYAAFRPWG